MSVDRCLAFGRGEQAGEYADGGRLARAILAEKAGDLTFVQAEVEVGQRHHRFGPSRERASEVTNGHDFRKAVGRGGGSRWGGDNGRRLGHGDLFRDGRRIVHRLNEEEQRVEEEEAEDTEQRYVPSTVGPEQVGPAQPAGADFGEDKELDSLHRRNVR